MKHLLIIIIIMAAGCSSPSEKNTEKYKAQIIQTELDFAKMADEAGVAAAFYEFSADSAVIGRGGKIIKGRDAIREYYEKNLSPATKLQWALTLLMCQVISAIPGEITLILFLTAPGK